MKNALLGIKPSFSINPDVEQAVLSSLSKKSADVPKLYALLSQYDEIVKTWLAESQHNMDEFCKNPVDAICNIPGIPLDASQKIKRMVADLRGKLSNPNYASSSNEYIPPSRSYTNGWDMISATHVKQINEAFKKFFEYPKHATVNVEQIIGNIPINGKISYDIDDIEIIKANDKTLTMRIFFLKFSYLQTFDPWMSIDPQPEPIYFELTSLCCEFEIKLEEVLGKTTSGNDCIFVQLGFSNDSVITITNITADKPDGVPLVTWLGIMELVQKIAPIFIRRLQTAGPYTVFTVNMENEKQEKFDWAIPKEMRFSGASTESQELNDYIMEVFAQTINQVTSDLVLDIPSGFISADDAIAIAFSEEIAAKYIFTPLINKAIDGLINNGKENNVFQCVKENNTFVIKSSKKYDIETQDQGKFTLSDSKFRMIDNGFHFETTYETTQYLLDCRGTVCCCLICKVSTTSDDGLTVIFETTEPDVTLDTSATWQICLIFAALFLIPIIGMLVAAIGLIVVEFADRLINLDFGNSSFSLTYPIEWNNIIPNQTADFQISKGILLSIEAETGTK